MQNASKSRTPAHPTPGTQESVHESARECACGQVAATADELADHLGEMFIPADDVASDGRRHAERFRDDDGTLRECLCGFTTVELRAVDAHLLAAFTPPDGIGADGREHG